MDDRTTSQTEREIRQQPQLWRRLADDITQRQEEITAFLTEALSRPTTRIILTGAGTSAFAGQMLAPEVQRRTGHRTDAIATTDLVSAPHDTLTAGESILLVSFARSGSSPESVAAAELVRTLSGEFHHLVITCNPVGELALASEDTSDLVLLMPDGSNDQGFAMTSSLTCMMLAALLTLGDLHDVDPIVSAAEHLLSNAESLLVDAWAPHVRSGVFLGSGSLEGLAREGALKLVELSGGRVFTYADTPMAFRHGPKSLLTLHPVVVVIESNDPHTRLYDRDLIAEVATSDDVTRLAVVGSNPAASHEKVLPIALATLTGLPDAALALGSLPLFQLLALRVSEGLGVTVDNPFAGGEVNRVVQGVTIHPLDEESSHERS